LSDDGAVGVVGAVGAVFRFSSVRLFLFFAADTSLETTLAAECTGVLKTLAANAKAVSRTAVAMSGTSVGRMA
jgi:hypothetical protein